MPVWTLASNSLHSSFLLENRLFTLSTPKVVATSRRRARCRKENAAEGAASLGLDMFDRCLAFVLAVSSTRR
jgi:hypothetical protein